MPNTQISSQPKVRRLPSLRPNLIIGGLLATIVVSAVALSLVWTPYAPSEMHIADRLQGPSADYLLGTDHFGRDILSMVMIGGQNTLFASFVAVAIGVTVGTAIGLTASAFRGWVEELVMRGCDFLLAFPTILAAIMISAATGPGIHIAITAIVVYNIPVFARLTRGAANAIWARDYIAAARIAGKGRALISVRHVLPNVMNPIIVQTTISFSSAILAEAALSYLGLSVQPPAPSWGRMLNEAQPYLYQAPFLAVYPGIAIAISVFSFNLLGDGLRDLLDPKMSRAR
ncbi:MAG: ABC transporter permease [Pseudomonadota bacterium]|nr:ABC transporter permease [Pseudomonadota bacterium]